MRKGKPREIKCSPKALGDFLRARKISFRYADSGYFGIVIRGRTLHQGSGIAGDDRWFWTDTKMTAHWTELTGKEKNL